MTLDPVLRILDGISTLLGAVCFWGIQIPVDTTRLCGTASTHRRIGEDTQVLLGTRDIEMQKLIKRLSWKHTNYGFRL
jgi:hypothetical protein